MRRPLLVTDPGVRAAGVFDRVVKALGDREHAAFDQTPSNPTEAAVRAAVDVFKRERIPSSLRHSHGHVRAGDERRRWWRSSHDRPIFQYGSPRIRIKASGWRFAGMKASALRPNPTCCLWTAIV